MNTIIQPNISKQKEKTVQTAYSVHSPAAVSDKYSKSRLKSGGFVAWPKTESAKSVNESKNFSHGSDEIISD